MTSPSPSADAPVPGQERQLELAQQTLDELLHAVSHDLGAPLRAMHGFARLLLQDHGPEVGEDARLMLERIVASGARAGKMVEAIRTHGRLARSSPKLEQLDLSTLAGTVAQRVFARHGRSLATLRLPPGLRLFADANQTQVLLEQLLDNACKFSAAEGARGIAVDLRFEADEAVLSVRDEGIGFDMAHAHKLFRLFQRLHRQDEYAGLGVGLAMVRLVVEGHGGRAWIDAAPGRGACVFCSFPLREAPGP